MVVWFGWEALWGGLFSLNQLFRKGRLRQQQTGKVCSIDRPARDKL